MAKFVSKVITAVLFLHLCSALAQVAPRECGYDRWPVKILADKDRNRVQFKAIDITVAKLVSIPTHEIPYPRDRRIEPEELQVFRVIAKLLRLKNEQDSDIHLLVADVETQKSG